MTPQRLSISLTQMPDGWWSITVLRTTCPSGRPAHVEALMSRHFSRGAVEGQVSEAVAMVMAMEDARLADERWGQVHPNAT